MFNLLRSFFIGQETKKINDLKSAVSLQTSDDAIIDTNIGELIVCGDESSGKSWVLRRLLQLGVFQTGEDIITRHPLRISLRYDAKFKTPQMTFIAPGEKPVKSESAELIHSLLIESHNRVQASGVGISDKEGRLIVVCDSVPNIDLIDLPGLLSFPAQGEPDDLPTKVKDLSAKYLTPYTMVLYIMDGKCNRRNSPAAGLLFELRPAKVITVITKVDCLRDDRQSLGPLYSFLQFFDKQGEGTVAVVNYEPTPNASFQDITNFETKFFSENVPDFESRKFQFGIAALLEHINRLAQKNCREDWAKKQHDVESALLASLQAQLKDLGPDCSSAQLADYVVTSLLEKDGRLEVLMQQAWDECKFALPSVDLYCRIEAPSGQKFASHMIMKLQQAIQSIIIAHPAKLTRYEEFALMSSNVITESFKQNLPLFLDRFQDLSESILRRRESDGGYEPSDFCHAAKHAFAQKVLLPLCVFSAPFVAEACRGNLQKGLCALFQKLSNAERADVLALRKDLQNKIQASQKILALISA